MSDKTPDGPTEFTPEPMPAEQTIQPVPEVPAPMASDYAPQALPNQPLAAQPDAYASSHPVGTPYDPQPMQGQLPTERNWMGIVALITAIIGMNIVAIVFAILGLNAVKQGKANNRGLSIAAIVISIIYFVLGILFAVLFFVIFANAASNASTSGADAEVGDCYVSTISATDELVSVDPAFGECIGSENAIVYYVTDYTGASTPDTPGITEELYNLCTTDAAIVAVDVELAENYYVEYYLPYANSWDTDPHTVVCGLSTDGEPVDTAVVIAN
jgi:hypothetical protein